MISRRTMLQLSASFTPLVLLPGSIVPAAAQKKPTQDSVQYQDEPNGSEKCLDCRFFVEPKSCQLVEGDIKPNGWCKLFQPAEDLRSL
jgi:hypothetical protein